jgi:hypothetical protein
VGADRLGGKVSKLLRRVALCLALPLGIGSPVVLVAAPAHAATTETVVALSDATPVYGQEVLATATVTSAGHPVTVGTVQFLVRNPGGVFTAFGSPVPLSQAGQATSVPVTASNGTPMHVTQGGHYTVRADYLPPSPEFDPSSNPSDPISVDKSGSSIAILPGPTTIVADLTGKLPGGVQEGSLKPSGPVSFTVDGAYAGSAELDQLGQATLSHTLPNGSPHTIVATYDGDGRYEGSSETLTRSDPTITARVLSRLPRAKSGWYRTSVDIRFKCDPAGSELVADCPEHVKLRRSGKNQSVTRTITAVDGGAATITVRGIDIDRQRPRITIIDKRTCKAVDKLSGVKRHRCTMRPLGNDQYLAVAVDRAGNRAVKRFELD